MVTSSRAKAAGRTSPQPSSPPKASSTTRSGPRTAPPPLGAEARALVAQRVLRARIRLALQQPFLATALMRLPVREAESAAWCRTAATDGYHIFYNPQWVGKLRDDELRGLLAHEVLHVLFAHSDRRQAREKKLWNVACDFAINILLVQRGFKLPKGGLISPQAKGKTAEQLYALLQQIAEQNGGKGGSAGYGLRGMGNDSTAKDSILKGDLAPPEPDEVPEAGDDLIDPEDPQVRSLRSAESPDPEQLEELRRELRDDALARLDSAEQALFKTEMQADEQRRVDWRTLLRTWLSDRIKGDWSSFPFSKRLLHRGLFMPSPGMQVPGHVVFAIDTSGSMSKDRLQQVMGELRMFREVFPCRLSVLQCDERVCSIEEYDALDGCDIPANFNAHGRGGTSFVPVFQWMAEHAEGALLLYATDGLGLYPEQAPASPVIWLITPPRADLKVPFGSVVQLDR